MTRPSTATPPSPRAAAAISVRPIRSESDHTAALDEIATLMTAEPDTPDPIAAIRFRMEQQGLTAQDIAPFIGTRARVSEVLNRRRPLSLSMIRRLTEGLGIPAAVLIRPTGAPSARGAVRKQTSRATPRKTAAGGARAAAKAGAGAAARGRLAPKR